MKVCVLSMQHVNNFGSLLQAYSLMVLLKDLGHEVDFINIEIHPEENKLMENNRKIYIEENDKYSSNKIVRVFKKVDNYFFKRIINRLKYEKQNKGFKLFRNRFLGISNTANNNIYDLCVIGSDEVFNCVQDTAWGFTSQLYGNVSQAKRVITYAASCGYATFDQLPKNVVDIIKTSLNRIDAFSVRDLNTFNFVNTLVGGKRKIIQNLDPALIGNFDDEIEKYGSKIKLPDKFCLIYAYMDRIHEKNDIIKIKDFCKKNKLKVISMGMPQQWTEKYIIANPFELLNAFKKASFVITDTFHGTIFSAKYADRFSIMLRKSNKNKLLDLVIKLGIQENVLSDFSELNIIYNVEVDKEKIFDVINFGKIQTIDYLQRNIW